MSNELKRWGKGSKSRLNTPTCSDQPQFDNHTRNTLKNFLFCYFLYPFLLDHRRRLLQCFLYDFDVNITSRQTSQSKKTYCGISFPCAELSFHAVIGEQLLSKRCPLCYPLVNRCDARPPFHNTLQALRHRGARRSHNRHKLIVSTADR